MCHTVKMQHTESHCHDVAHCVTRRSGDSSVVRAPDSRSKGRWYESRQEQLQEVSKLVFYTESASAVISARNGGIVFTRFQARSKDQEIKRREVELDLQVSPEEIMSRDV